MVAKIVQGRGFRGVVNYVLDKDKAKLLCAEGVRMKDKESVIHSFITQSKLKPGISKPVAHISLDFSAQDKERLTDRVMAGIALEYMKQMGYVNTQFIIARHHDTDHPHVHLVINRIDNDGNRISDKNEKLRSTKICMELTKKYGLYIASGKENVKEHRLREPDKTRYEIYHALQTTVPHCRNWQELKTALMKSGITVEFRHNGSTDKIQGIRFNKNGYGFNGSKIDRSCSYSKIDFQLRQNERQQNMSVTGQHQESRQDNPKHSSILETAASVVGGLGLFDFQPSSGYDENEMEARRQSRKKKKKKRRYGRQL